MGFKREDPDAEKFPDRADCTDQPYFHRQSQDLASRAIGKKGKIVVYNVITL